MNRALRRAAMTGKATLTPADMERTIGALVVVVESLITRIEELEADAGWPPNPRAVELAQFLRDGIERGDLLSARPD